jgi:hypothetical protein
MYLKSPERSKNNSMPSHSQICVFQAENATRRQIFQTPWVQVGTFKF